MWKEHHFAIPPPPTPSCGEVWQEEMHTVSKFVVFPSPPGPTWLEGSHDFEIFALEAMVGTRVEVIIVGAPSAAMLKSEHCPSKF